MLPRIQFRVQKNITAWNPKFVGFFLLKLIFTRLSIMNDSEQHDLLNIEHTVNNINFSLIKNSLIIHAPNSLSNH